MIWSLTDAVGAQNWATVGDVQFHSPGNVNVIYGDSTLDRLFAGGTYRGLISGNDTLDAMAIATWNGVRWDTLAHNLVECNGANGCPPVWEFMRYQNRLFVNGAFPFYDENNVLQVGFAELDEQNMHWKGLGCDNAFTNGIATMVPVPPQDTAYLTGYDGTLCGLDTSNVFAFDGTTITPFAPFVDLHSSDEDYVGLVFKFRGQLYMTGLLDDTVANSTYSFLRYTGSAWEPVPGFTSYAPIKDILIHDDTLYMCGYFFEYQGAPGNLVTMYDGTTWSAMGGGLTYDQQGQSTYGIAYDLYWWHGRLYVAGQFNYASGVPVEGIAQWDGHKWCGSGADFSGEGSVLMTITSFRDTLYVGGGFLSIDGAPFDKIARWDGDAFDAVCSPAVGLPEPINGAGFHVYPNPAEDLLNWTTEPGNINALVLDATGRVVRNEGHVQGSFALHGLAPGCYTLVLSEMTGGSRRMARFIKR